MNADKQTMNAIKDFFKFPFKTLFIALLHKPERGASIAEAEIIPKEPGQVMLPREVEKLSQYILKQKDESSGDSAIDMYLESL